MFSVFMRARSKCSSALKHPFSAPPDHETARFRPVSTSSVNGVLAPKSVAARPKERAHGETSRLEELLPERAPNGASRMIVGIEPRPFIGKSPWKRVSKPCTSSSAATASDTSTSPGGQCCSSRAATFTVEPKSRKRGSLSPTMPATTDPQ